jgi:hypothetical protein
LFHPNVASVSKANNSYNGVMAGKAISVWNRAERHKCGDVDLSRWIWRKWELSSRKCECHALRCLA